MASIRTVNFLPEVFRSKANRKFLNATIDQLVTPPSLVTLNGYVGRKFAPTFKKGDNYIIEQDPSRQNYQLEPGVVLRNDKKEVDEFYSYNDLIQQIRHYGGLTDNHSRLFESEMYSYHGFIDLDKLVNFSQYWWVGDKLDSVKVSSGDLPLTNTFTVTRDQFASAYKVDKFKNDVNPTLTLLRGGKYDFVVEQPGHQFWIQTQPGMSGTRLDLSNVSTRDIYGVTNNGEDHGTVEFVVPQKTDQDQFVTMPVVGEVDFVSTLRFADVDNQLLSDVLALDPNGFDGVRSAFQGKYVTFIGSDISDEAWTEEGIYGQQGYDQGQFDEGQIVALADRWAIWRMDLVQEGPDYRIQLSKVATIPQNNKVLVESGNTYAGREIYRANNDRFVLVPIITATLEKLYYVDSTNPNFVGEINIVDTAVFPVNVNDILGKRSYTSPNGVEFSNGLLVEFDAGTLPAEYASKQFFVEGVGRSIELVDRTALVVPELTRQFTSVGWDITGFDSQAFEKVIGDAQINDYITIKRNSSDNNAWSRSNRWVHTDVITQTFILNNKEVDLSLFQRAQRPIIEFRENMKLFNYGKTAVRSIALLNTTVQNALSTVEGSTNLYQFGEQIVAGSRVIFAGDFDPIIRNNIYEITHELVNGVDQIHLVEVGQIKEFDTVIPEFGINAGIVYHFENGVWNESQQKTGISQAPLFDIVDATGESISSLPGSTFAGTTLFEYKPGTGRADPILKFPLSYKSFNNVGDIEFNNTYELGTFSYNGASASLVDYFVPIIEGDDYSFINDWETVGEQSKQFQTFIFTYISSNRFEIDILPDESESSTAYARVFVNSKMIDRDQYVFETTALGKKYVTINVPLVEKDSIVVQVYSKDVSKTAFYEVPKNLDLNALNKSFTTTTLGQLRNHLIAISQDSNLIVGQIPGNSNARDINTSLQTGAILQHSSPLVFASLFMLNKDLNFIDSLDFARKDYLKFKNRFLEMVPDVLSNNIYDPIAGVDYILQRLAQVKSIASPWYFSDMVPYNNEKVVIRYTVINRLITEYQLNEIFDDTVLSNKAVLVYLNSEQLVKDRDYTFRRDRATVSFNVELETNDVIELAVYNDTDGNFVPSTPTKLGLYPKFIPLMFEDDSYRTPTTVIRGHDGSITPAFGDIRDEMLLELEKRIYNNIKVSYDPQSYDIHEYLPGKFRDISYSREEFAEVLSGQFLAWVGDNRVDYSKNEWFQNSDPWSWNYGALSDTIDGERLPGYWRGIFQYYYDTDIPHIAPWEMLGFTEQPTWWENRYGPAPWTGGNQVMWDDLEAGRIAEGERAGTYEQYARPGLSKIIPVTDYGVLKPPSEILVQDYNSRSINAPFKVGDLAPVEAAWRRSSDYPFAVQRAIALTHPAAYFGLLLNVSRYRKNDMIQQYTVADSNLRLGLDTIRINGTESVDGTITRTNGYINWVAEHMLSKGIDSKLRIPEILASVDVNLGYQVAGFTDKNYIRVLAEQSSPSSVNDSIIIPDSDYQVVLHKSPSIRRAVYSAVIVEQTSAGYTVRGYNNRDPFFKVLPIVVSNNVYKINEGPVSAIVYKDFSDQAISVPYGTTYRNRQEVVDFLVSYGRYLESIGFVFDEFDYDLSAQRDWTLSAREFLFWTRQGWQEGSILVLSPVVNILRFESADAAIDEITNQPNGSRVLDVGFNVVKKSLFTVLRDNEIVEVESSGDSLGLVDLSAVQYEHVLVFNNETVFRDVIYKPESGNRQYRLKVVGNKTGNWNGQLSPEGFIISNPVTEEWQTDQDYKKGDIVLFKSRYYTALEPVLASQTFDFTRWEEIDSDAIKTGMLPNFAYKAGSFEDMYDVDRVVNDEQLATYGNGLLGFRERGFMNDTGMTPNTQIKFYQGYIKDKGTKSSFNALASAQFNNVSGDILFNEEWAFRVGSYGALNNNQYFEVILDEVALANNKPVVTFVESTNSPVEPVSTPITPASVFKKSYPYTTTPLPTVDVREPVETDLLSAGYVSLDDVEYKVFSVNSIATLNDKVESIRIGDLIWTATGRQTNWAVHRVTRTDLRTVEVSYGLTNRANVVFNRAHGFAVGDAFLIKNLRDTVDGFYYVSLVTDYNSVIVEVPQAVTDLLVDEAITQEGVVFSLVNVRVPTANLIADIAPSTGWIDGDKVWVDKLAIVGKDRWAVLEKTSPWVFRRDVESSSYVAGSRIGSAAAMNVDGTFALIGVPELNNKGAVKVLVTDVNDDLVESTTIASPDFNQGGQFGYSLAFAEDIFVVGAPTAGGTGDGNGSGLVFVYRISPLSGNIELSQVITKTTFPAGRDDPDRFGHSVALSHDGKMLYVGAPGLDTVFCYTLDQGDEWSITQAGLSANGIVDLGTNTITSGDSVLVTLNSHSNYAMVEGLDYTISGSTLTLSLPGGLPAPPTFTVTVSQKAKSFTEITNISGTALTKFGYSLSTDATGELLLVGSPNANSLAGQVKVYNRYVEKFVGDRSNRIFQLKQTISPPDVRVFVNGVQSPHAFTVIGSNDGIQFTAFTPNITDTITVDANIFVLLQELNPTPGQNGRYGTSVAVSANGDQIAIGEPYAVDGQYSSGFVHRYTNYATRYNTVRLVSKGNDDFSNDVSFRLDNSAVVSVDNSAEQIALAINDAKVFGVTATHSGNVITIVKEAGFNVSPLTFLPAKQSTILGTEYELFTFNESLRHVTGNNEQFGQAVTFDKALETIAVTSSNANTRTYNEIDNGNTIFDGGVTQIYSEKVHSGAVYVYELLAKELDTIDTPAAMTLVQKLEAPGIDQGDQFGYAVAMANGVCVVGSPADSDRAANAGKIYEFKNEGKEPGWRKRRVENERVEPNSIIRSFLYSNRDQSIHTMLDLLDPIKGRILGAAEQEIDYKTDYDPAVYSVTAAGTPSGGLIWTDAHVGKIWWDTSTVRYVDYEQGTLAYRLANWGRTFPGSTITIAQWVESDNPPAGYAGTGSPKNLDKYSTRTSVSRDGTLRVKYYYWVVDRTDVDELDRKHSLSPAAIRDMISNPESTGVPYIQPLRNDSISLVNARSFLLGTDTLLHVDFGSSDSVGLVHNEYELAQEGAGFRDLPEKIINKMIDSLSGKDAIGQPVPDPSLGVGEKYGVLIRPRQTMFIDKLKALDTFISFVNTVLKDELIVGSYGLTRLLDEDPDPADGITLTVNDNTEFSYVDTSNFVTGNTVLVQEDLTENGRWAVYTFNSLRQFDKTSVQSYSTPEYWEYADWVTPQFDDSVPVTYIVEREADIAKLALQPNDTVQVTTSSGGQTIVYEFDGSLNRRLVKVFAGTIQLSQRLVTNASESTTELRNIFYAIKNEIFINTLRPKFNELFFVLLNYILSEQKKIDWAFKTSFISIVHSLRKLSQYPSYVRDNQSFYEEYVNEVKPYRTKIREYLIGYSGEEEANVDSSDFDLPAYYDEQLGRWRSPSGEQARDATIIDTFPQYAAWKNTYGLKIDRIVLRSGGTGYSQPPAVNIVGGGGSGATARATFDALSGRVTSVVVTNPGNGYTSTPTVELLGDGNGAAAYAMLGTSLARNITTTVSFDRTAYSSQITKWEPQTAYQPGDVVTFNSKSYVANQFASFEAYYETRDSMNRTAWNFKWYDTNGNIIVHVAEPANSTNVYNNTDIHHIALVREDAQFILYRDGSPVAIQTALAPLPNLNTDFLIGKGRMGRMLDGEIAGLRITKGVRRYDSPFNNSLPTLPLPDNIGGDPDFNSVVLLQNFAGDTLDSSNSAHAVTVNGTPGFGTDGILLNGNTDFLSISDSDDWYFHNDQTDSRVTFTIEWFFRAAPTVNDVDLLETSNSAYSFLSQSVELTQEIIDSLTFFNPLRFTLLDDNRLSSDLYKNAADRVVSFYQGGVSTDNIVDILPKVFGGIDYPGVLVTSPKFTDVPTFDVDEFDDSGLDDTESPDGFTLIGDSSLDSIITGTFNEDLISDPEDVIIDGGDFIDTYSSHAPEELLPARIFDTLDIRVFTKDPGSFLAAPIAYRMFKDLKDNVSYYRISDQWSTTLRFPLFQDDAEIFVVDATRLPVPDPSNNRPGVIFIHGERIQYAEIDTVNHILSKLTRGTRGTGAGAVYPATEVVTDASIRQLIPGTNTVIDVEVDPLTGVEYPVYADVVWYELDPGANLVLGTGLYDAVTTPANFLRNYASYEPGEPIDPNLEAELFDFSREQVDGSTVNGGFDNPNSNGFDSFIT